jgi:hypothetical protein
MRLPRRAREYERTCDDCGYAWRVPRRLARKHIESISGFSVVSRGVAIDRAELNAEIQSSMAVGEQAEAYRRCPKCSSGHYAQRPVRS